MKRLLLLSLLCIFLGTGCGIMRTSYELPASATVSQKQRAMQAVDTVARSLGFTPDTQETERRRNQGSPSYRRYFMAKGLLVLHAEIAPHLTYAYLSRGGKTKTRDFIATEEALTASLRRISPNVIIITGYVESPMM